MVSNTRQASAHAAEGPRKVARAEFDAAYSEVVLRGHFFEADDYYLQHKRRYRRTLERVCRIPAPTPARILEIGGGQIVLLCNKLFGDSVVLGDVNPDYSKEVKDQGIEFAKCDLLHDDLDYRDEFDIIVLCEVVEHLPVPLYTILEKVKKWMKPGGHIFITTPNMYRFRNLVRLALGMRVFDLFLYPEPGKSIGHPFEYYEKHLRWHLDKAGFEVQYTELTQLVGFECGATLLARVGRFLASPVAFRRLWRDSLVACARRPRQEQGPKE